MRLSHKHVNNLIFNLKAIFLDLGRGDVWDDNMSCGNPGYSKDVFDYTKAVAEEQSESHVAQKQASPMELTKLARLAEYLDREIKSLDTTLRNSFLLLRDKAFFLLQFYTGSRGGDLTKLLVQEVRHLPDNSGVVIRETFGKQRAEQFITIKNCTRVEVCPVVALQQYLSKSAQLGVDITEGFVFRATSNSGCVLDKRITQQGINNRLVHYLSMLGIYEGESTHSIRAGCATFLRSADVSSQEAAEHVGWKSRSMWEHYSRANMALHNQSAVAISTALASSNSVPSDDSCISTSGFMRLNQFLTK